jgi:predicted amidophosphoribosyltransferase
VAANYCKHCGAPLSSKDNFCSNCGQPLDAAPPIRQESYKAPQASTRRAIIGENSTIGCIIKGWPRSAKIAAVMLCVWFMYEVVRFLWWWYNIGLSR